MLKFISFGSGSSGNCYYIYSESESLLIDAGIGLRTLKKYFKDRALPFNIANCLITHDHTDHVKSIGGICKECGTTVYATREVHQGIERNYCVKYKIPQERKVYVEKQKQFSIGNFVITPFNVPHDSSDNVGYLIEYEGVRLCIVTDAGETNSEIGGYISKATHLILESNYDKEMLLEGPYPEHLKARIRGGRGHLSNTECGETLIKYATPNLQHVWLCHLSAENNHPELARKTIESCLRNNGIIAGSDFKLDVLKRRTPSETYILIP